MADIAYSECSGRCKIKAFSSCEPFVGQDGLASKPYCATLGQHSNKSALAMTESCQQQECYRPCKLMKIDSFVVREKQFPPYNFRSQIIMSWKQYFSRLKSMIHGFLPAKMCTWSISKICTPFWRFWKSTVIRFSHCWLTSEATLVERWKN